MSDASLPRVDDPETAFRMMVAALTEDRTLGADAVVLLEFCGKAMGLTARRRRELARHPHTLPPPATELPALVRPFLADAPAEVRTDATALLTRAFGADPALRVPPPFCPVCKDGRAGGSARIWSPPHDAGLGSYEESCLTVWSCRGCEALLECSDRLGAEDRARAMRIRITSPEMRELLQEVAAAPDAEALVAVLRAAPPPQWLLERVPAIRDRVGALLVPDRARLVTDPDEAPAAYAASRGVARLGPPPSAPAWRRLVDAPLPPGLLARLAPLPGAPRDVRQRLLLDPDPEIRHQALQAPDVPTDLLLEQARGGDTAAQLSLLDRPDVGRRLLTLLIERGDPHVLYRAGRHPFLDLPLLSRIRLARRRGGPDVLPASRVLHVYAPSSGRSGAPLLDQVVARVRRESEAFGWVERTGPGAVEIVCARVSLSRVLVLLPPSAPGTPGSLEVERLAELLKQSLVSGVAEEVVELVVDEASGHWSADIRHPGGAPQRASCSNLPVPRPGDDPGPWLEFELFAAERALAHPGIPVSLPTPRLVTRPPYVPLPAAATRRETLTFSPDPEGDP